MTASTEAKRTWTVRELADEQGITTRTLRFYEAEGLLRPERDGVAECREIVTMYDGAASSERRQLEVLLGRLGEISADLSARQDDLRRTLAEVNDVATQCRNRLGELG